MFWHVSKTTHLHKKHTTLKNSLQKNLPLHPAPHNLKTKTNAMPIPCSMPTLRPHPWHADGIPIPMPLPMPMTMPWPMPTSMPSQRHAYGPQPAPLPPDPPADLLRCHAMPRHAMNMLCPWHGGHAHINAKAHNSMPMPMPIPMPTTCPYYANAIPTLAPKPEPLPTPRTLAHHPKK